MKVKRLVSFLDAAQFYSTGYCRGMDRIGQKRPLRWYVREWRKHRGLTLDQLADRLETNRGQISKLERGDLRMNDDWIAGFADALAIEPSDLLRPPDAPARLDVLMQGQPPEKQRQAFEIISAFLKAS